ncbi:MAG: F0F1 ATP synthase subunit delta [Candidatus Abawacabacteria bacterium]|nr:F0F1 ATP synthase subunit delta [Candidatus Abawacabacteria bacterium]
MLKVSDLAKQCVKHFPEITIKDIEIIFTVLDDQKVFSFLSDKHIPIQTKLRTLKKIKGPAYLKGALLFLASALAEETILRTSLEARITGEILANSGKTTVIDITLAQSLGSKVQKQLEAFINKELLKSKKSLYAVYHIDPDMLGGIIIAQENFTWNYSVRKQLDQFKQMFTSTTFDSSL